MEDISLEDFLPHLQRPFRVITRDAELEFVLTQATATGAGIAKHRQPFSLMFQGPAKPLLPQATYDFEHPEHGTIGIFIVPIGADGSHSNYEAIFS